MNINKYLNSKWTSVSKIKGWRHFVVRNVIKKYNKLELFSVCNKKIVIIVPLTDIVDTRKWAPGWDRIV